MVVYNSVDNQVKCGRFILYKTVADPDLELTRKEGSLCVCTPKKHFAGGIILKKMFFTKNKEGARASPRSATAIARKHVSSFLVSRLR